MEIGSLSHQNQKYCMMDRYSSFLIFQDTDAATYRCYVVGQSKVIYHDTQIVVEECEKLSRGPYMIDPFPENQAIYDYGGNVTFQCTGYFGCTEKEGVYIVLWVVEGSSKPITNISSRYSISKMKCDRYV
ncbi:uncharacterized protein LOC132744174 [Ruditapes philippinarum]|uniref:uncharacterized protein LOC132744174 n=1 Tax=Ruditapes philippinarum TaxID=129788 RepID=UPI00295BA93F|nr:uncharacterized protein LOC132744174 [Ruditapes philippinarum]